MIISKKEYSKYDFNKIKKQDKYYDIKTDIFLFDVVNKIYKNENEIFYIKYIFRNKEKIKYLYFEPDELEELKKYFIEINDIYLATNSNIIWNIVTSELPLKGINKKLNKSCNGKYYFNGKDISEIKNIEVFEKDNIKINNDIISIDKIDSIPLFDNYADCELFKRSINNE